MALAWQSAGGLGFDSNVSLLPDDSENSDTSAEDSAFWQLHGQIGAAWRSNSPHRFRVQMSAQNTSYSDADEFDAFRIGGLLNWQRVGQQWITHASVSLNNYRIDNEQVLLVPGLQIGAAKIYQSKDVSFVSLKVNGYQYDERDELDGNLVSIKAHHWFVKGNGKGNAGRRLELQYYLGKYTADASSETYSTLRLGLSGKWRFDQLNYGRRIDLSSGVHLDLRNYDGRREGADESEKSTRWDLVNTATWWYGDRQGLTFLVGYSNRSSNDDSRDFDRWRTSLSWHMKW